MPSPPEMSVSLLGEVGNLIVAGSIAGQDDITTDVIFRSGVTVNGDVDAVERCPGCFRG